MLGAQQKILHILYTLIVIIGCLYAGKVIANYITILPASLYGMLLFAALLVCKIISAETVKSTVNWIISNMGVCFVPAGIGIMQYTVLIKNYGLLIAVVIICTTLILLTATGYFYQRYLNKNDLN